MNDENRKKIDQLLSAPRVSAPNVEKPPPVEEIPELSASEVEDLAKEATPYALRALFKIGMDSEVAKGVRVAALREVLDRGLGKATQKVDMDFTANEYLDMIHQARTMKASDDRQQEQGHPNSEVSH